MVLKPLIWPKNTKLFKRTLNRGSATYHWRDLIEPEKNQQK